MSTPGEIAFTCPVCGTPTRATVATGLLHRHTPPGQTKRCTGSRRVVFPPVTPGPQTGSAATREDFDWFSRKPLSIPVARLKPHDIATAKRLLKAASSKPKKYGFMRPRLREFLNHARTVRPDLFQSKQQMRVRHPVAAIDPSDLGNPNNRFNAQRKDAGKNPWRREILVGKRD